MGNRPTHPDTGDADHDRLLKLSDDIDSLVEAAAAEGICPHCLCRAQLAALLAFAGANLNDNVGDWLADRAEEVRSILLTINEPTH